MSDPGMRLLNVLGRNLTGTVVSHVADIVHCLGCGLVVISQVCLAAFSKNNLDESRKTAI